MAQKQRTVDPDPTDNIGVYATNGPTDYTKPMVNPIMSAPINTVVAPTDRVRWGPIFAGLFATLSSLVVLSVLGLAVGLGSFDAGDPLGSFGVGAGIWGGISTLIAFIIGGWLAARTSAAAGRGNGVLNGAMVWVVAIPLIIYLLGSGLGSLVSTAGSVAATGITAAAPAAAAVADDAAAAPGAEATAQDAGADVAAAAQATVAAVGEAVTPERVEDAAGTASGAAWGTLIALLVGLGAAALGGSLGARREAPVNTTQALAT